MDEKDHLNSLKRGLHALTILNAEGGLTLSELAKRLALPRATTYRVLETLAAEGYVSRDAGTKAFTPTSQVRSLAHGFNRDDLIAQVARPILRSLCRKTLMPVGMTMPVGGAMVVQVSMDFESPMALVRYPEGTSFPITYGPSGHLFLAHCDQSKRDRIVTADMAFNDAHPQLYPGKAPSSADLQVIERQGYAIELGPYPVCVEGCMAVPIFCNGAYVASLTQRFMKKVLSRRTMVERFLEPMRATAQEIEASLARQSDALEGLVDDIGYASPLRLADASPRH